MQNPLMQLIHHPRSVAGIVEAHFPALRRHAEAMSGSRNAADAYMAAVMDILAVDITALPAASNARIGLFKLYTRLYASLASLEQPAQARARQVLLLVLMEGFSKKDTAEILDVSMAEVVTILKAAGAAMPELTCKGVGVSCGKGRLNYRPIRTSALGVAC